MAITLIYVECAADKSGDYTGAAELAYVLQQRFTGSDNRCVLASSAKGVKKLLQLYGDPTGVELRIHDVSMEVTTLAALASSGKKEEIRNYIEVAKCQPPEPDLVRRVITPETRLLFVGLPHNSNLLLFQLSRYGDELVSKKAHVVNLGLGASRIGVTIYDGVFSPINHAAYRNMATIPYAFTYFNGATGALASAFIKDLLKIYLVSAKYPTQNYIIVGDSVRAKAGIESFCLLSKKPTQIFDITSGKLTTITRSEAKEETLLVSKSLSESDQPSTASWNFLLLPSVPNSQMRPLMKFSQPLIGVTGVGSMLEAMAFGKFPLCQFLPQNKYFTDSYKAAMCAIPETQKLIWEAPLSRSAIGEISAALQDEKKQASVVSRQCALVKEKDVPTAILPYLNCGSTPLKEYKVKPTEKEKKSAESKQLLEDAEFKKITPITPSVLTVTDRIIALKKIFNKFENGTETTSAEEKVWLATILEQINHLFDNKHARLVEFLRAHPDLKDGYNKIIRYIKTKGHADLLVIKPRGSQVETPASLPAPGIEAKNSRESGMSDLNSCPELQTTSEPKGSPAPKISEYKQRAMPAMGSQSFFSSPERVPQTFAFLKAQISEPEFIARELTPGF